MMLVQTPQKWSKNNEACWWFVKAVFALLAATSLGLCAHHSFMALPIFVLGLYKFGMPETISYLYVALHDTTKSSMSRWSDFLNGAGTAVHHPSASFVICMFLAGVLSPTHEALDGLIILVLQHVVVPLKYVNIWLYLVVQLIYWKCSSSGSSCLVCSIWNRCTGVPRLWQSPCY